jgi:hypothetical protein
LVAVAYAPHASIETVGVSLAFGGSVVLFAMAIVMYEEACVSVDS